MYIHNVHQRYGFGHTNIIKLLIDFTHNIVIVLVSFFAFFIIILVLNTVMKCYVILALTLRM